MVKLSGIREKVFLDRYALKGQNEELLEHIPEEMWKRVSKGIAKQEKKESRSLWEKKFYEILEDFKFVPGGRILSGAGTSYEVTYFNCFVIPSPKDSREGILDSLKQLVEIQSRSGGVGLNLSSLRPRGSRVRKVNGTSSGPVTWAGLFSYATHDVVQQGGTRRGATMLMLWDWHPDVEEFITVKQDLSKINGANLSICVSDDFMAAVKNDSNWDLVYPDLDDPKYDLKWNGNLDEWKQMGGKIKIYKTVKAKYLWDLICGAAWRSAEPGLHFLERSNKRSNTSYFERLVATNPSLRAGTKILTKKGIFPIEQLEGQRFLVKNLNGEWSEADCFISGRNRQLYKITLFNDQEIFATAQHKWPVALRGGGFDKVTTDNLKTSHVLPFPHVSDIDFIVDKPLSYDEGFMIGWMYGGDEWISDEKPDGSDLGASLYVNNNLSLQLQTYPLGLKLEKTKKVFEFIFSEEEKILSKLILPEVNKLKKIPSCLTKLRDNTYAIQANSFEFKENLTRLFGVDKKEKGLPKTVWISGGNFIKGVMDGLMSSYGYVSKDSNRIVFVTKHKAIAEDIQSLLSLYGIKSNIALPNHKSLYEHYSVSIDGYNVVNFSKIFKFSHPEKQVNLERLVENYRVLRSVPDDGLIRIKKVEKTDIKEDVWDISVYDSTHCFVIDNCITGNCGEQPLGAWAVCNLGAMNLSVYVNEEKFDFINFGKDVKTAMRFLDNVIDQTYYFFKENEKVAKDIRRTGLGIMGLADALIKMKLRYGSDKSLPVIRKIFETLRNHAYEASCEIAKQKGAFPKFDVKKYLDGYHIKALPSSIRESIKKHGIRNAVLLTIAPTGTTSLLSGVSSGIEPVYEFVFIRKDRTGEHILYHPLFEEWKKNNPDQKKPDYFVSANDLTPLEHVRVQAIAQEYIDSSISKTVNAPNVHTVEDVKTLYMSAYDMGLKGVTYMRDGSREGVLSRIDDQKKEDKKELAHQSVVSNSPIAPRPMALSGVTYQMLTPVGKTYVTINHDSKGDPFEVFITVGKSGSDVAAMADALGRMISVVLRLSGGLSPRERMRQTVAHLSGIGGTRSVGFGKEKVRSLPDAVSKLLAMHFDFTVNGKVEDKQINGLSNGTENGFVKDHNKNDSPDNKPVVIFADVASTSLYDICPSCGAGSLAYEEGCKKCYSCGYSEC